MALQVIVFITAKPGCRDAVLAAFNDNVPRVLAEDGCEAYGAYVDAAGYRPPLASFGPDTLVVLERWTTREALKAHATAAHVLAYQAKVKDWIETRMVHVMSPV